MTIEPALASERRPRWPWVMLGLGLVWTVLIRVPLVLNAEDHLDSDLAVDGLTLRDACDGHWRWHYPGTPYMGIPPMLISYPQALIWGANAITLVSGGTVIWVLVVATTFWLAWKVFGLEIAGWAIVPLIFSSLGTIWLSGRITGGHLLTLVWHTVAFLGLYACLKHGGWRRAAILGFWCGLGLYLDLMFALTLAGLIPSAIFVWFRGNHSRAAIGLTAVFLAGLLAGLVPRGIGRMVDPYDAYPSQFAPTVERGPVIEHVRLLVLHCLPRLVAGKELYGLDENSRQNDAGTSPLPWWLAGRSGPSGMPAAHEWLAILLLGILLAGLIRLAADGRSSADLPRIAVARGLLLSALLIVVAFVVNRNIFNSDNYRYLIYLLPCWALGFGLLSKDLATRGLPGQVAAWIVTAFVVEAMTAATFHWYRDTRHYLDEKGRPVALHSPSWSELTIRGGPIASGRPSTSSRRFDVHSDVTHVFGGYWDVYRMAFLSKGQVVGIPYPMFPNRFQGWSRGLGADVGKLLVLEPRYEASRGGKPAADLAGSQQAILFTATRIDWRPAFKTVWNEDGRPTDEVDRLRVVVP
jgi:hypothetical protein